MGRTIKEIYQQAREYRDQYLELSEIQNSSKMSVMDAITWVTSACIWSFENILDVFQVDLAQDLSNRINGTPAYFANALIKYQHGDELLVSENGGQFYYANVDPSKRIVSKVAYFEVEELGFHDKTTIYKVAGGEPGKYFALTNDELASIRDYLSKILFAGQQAKVLSLKGDVLIPKVTVYYDGYADKEVVFNNVKHKLDEYIRTVGFNARIYVQQIIDAIQSAEHVVDVYIDNNKGQGIFLAQYNDDNIIMQDSRGAIQLDKLERYIVPNSGYIRETSRQNEEIKLPNWRETIELVIENKR